MAELKCLATCCEFSDHLEEALRDRLVCGMHNQGILKQLLAESELTYTKAVEVVSSMEAAERPKAPEGTRIGSAASGQDKGTTASQSE